MTIKQIENFPNYYVSTEGDIYSTKKSKTLIKLKPWIDSKGKYLQIGLINSEGKRIKMLVHRIVAITFIPNHNNLPEINHKDTAPCNSYGWCHCSQQLEYRHHCGRYCGDHDICG